MAPLVSNAGRRGMGSPSLRFGEGC
jgi:hypothetical protein